MTARRELRGDGSFDFGFGAGINEQDEYNINIQECSEGFNFILDPVGTVFERRSTQDVVATAPNAGTITAIMQLVKRDDTQTQLVASDSIIYKWNGSSVFSDVTPTVFVPGSRLRAARWSLQDYLVISDLDLATRLLQWDGTTCDRLPTGVSIGEPMSVTTLTRSASTATAVTAGAHGYNTGDYVVVNGADPSGYNLDSQITVTDSITFTYPVDASLTTPATGTITADEASVVKAKHALVHNGRMWLFNLDVDGTAFPQLCLVSDFEDPQNYDNVKRAGDSSFTTGNEAFFLVSPDLRPIINADRFYDQLVIATKDGQLFSLSGDDATNYAFESFYSGSGSASEEGMANMGNDLVYFRTGKAIESLLSTDKYGDVAADDLSWWIPTSVKQLSAPIAIYDQTQQKVYFFDESLEGVMVLDKTFMSSDKFTNQRLSPWSKYVTAMSNNFITKVATQIRAADAETFTVYWGDSAGVIYNINGIGDFGDGGTTKIDVSRKSRVITDLNTNDELTVGRLEYQRSDEVDVDLIFAWLDELNLSNITITLKEPEGAAEFSYFGSSDIYWGDSDLYWGADTTVADTEQRSNQGFSAVGSSTGFVLTINLSVTGTFKIARIYV